MQTLNFFLSLGTILAPIVTVPFLSSEDRVLKDVNLNQTNWTNNEIVKNRISPKYLDVLLVTNTFENQTISDDHHLATKSQIHIAYAIIGFITFVAGLVINLLYLFAPYDDDENKRKEAFVFPLPKKPKESRFSLANLYYWTVLVLCCTITCFYYSMTINNSNYIQAFGVESELTSKTTGSYLTLTYSCVLTFSCFCFVFISAKLPPALILLADFALMVLSNILICCGRSVPMLWTAIVLLGIGMSSVQPSLYSYMKQRIDVNNVVISIITFSSGLIAMFYPLMNGYYIEAFPLTFPIINLVSVLIMIVLFVFINLFDLIYNKKVRNELSIRKSTDDDASLDAYKTNTHL